MNQPRLQNKIAIVTGAGRGIGKGIATRLAQEGATIVIADYATETATATAHELAQAGSITLPYTIDVTQTKPLLDLNESDWDRVMNVNLRGMFFCLQAVANQMLTQIPAEIRAHLGLSDVVKVKADTAGAPPTLAASYGKIVNMASISGRRGRPLAAHYAASKAATMSVTQSAALALAPYNINVNAVSPSVVATPMWDQIDAERGQLFGSAPGEAMRAFINTIPLKRAGTPADIGGAIAFLCSSDADYITGQTLNVDGGYEMD